MSKKGGTTVEGVDPWEVGRADATFNRIDQYTPFGSLTYSGPNRNQADLQLNPFLAGNENRRMLSDRMLLDTALGRQQSMNQGGLPSLTSGINPGALNEFFGLPSQLQTGFDQAPTPPPVGDYIGQSSGPSGGKGGAQGPMPLQGDPGYWNDSRTPRSVLDQGAKGGQQPTAPQTMGSAQQQFAPMVQQQKTSQGVGDIGQPQMSDPLTAQSAPPGQNPAPNPIFGGTVGGIIDPNSFGQIQSLDQLQDFELDRGRVEQNFYDRSASLLDPQYDQAEQRMVSDLRARGIPRDSEAFEREMSNFRRDKGETFSRLANQSVLSGGGEQSRQFGLASALGDRSMAAQQGLFGMADQLSQRDIQAQLQNANIAQANRATQFNELASLLGLQQVASPGLNNFFAPGNADVTSGFAMNQQAQMANARNAASQKGGMLGGLGQLGGAAIGAGGFGGLFNQFGGGNG
jgi:hypothetical protein